MSDRVTVTEYKVLKEVSKRAKVGTDEHAKFCYLMKPLVSGTVTSKLETLDISAIHYDVVRPIYGTKGAIALTWFMSDACSISKDHTDTLKRFIQQTFNKDDKDVEEFRFRQLLVKVATKLSDGSKPKPANLFVQYVASQYLDEPTQNFNSAEFKSLLKLFQTICERDIIGPRPEKLETLKEMLEEAEREDITKLVADFKSHNPISIKGTLDTLGPSEEEQTPDPDTHSELAL